MGNHFFIILKREIIIMSSTTLNKFRDFGEKFHIVAIFTIVGIFLPFLQIVNLILIFLALKSLKEVNTELRSGYLSEFRSKFIAAYLVRIIGIIMIAFSAMFLIFSLIFSDGVFYGFFIGASILLLIGFIILISGSVVEMKAWKELKKFFEKNRDLFPSHVVKDGIKGCDQLKNGALMFALSFLIITVLIGYIFQILGYFNLSEFKDLPYQYEGKPIQTQSGEELAYQSENGEIGNFCPRCGAKIAGKIRFCPECGANLLEE
jgi:hypothetical protein